MRIGGRSIIDWKMMLEAGPLTSDDRATIYETMELRKAAGVTYEALRPFLAMLRRYFR